MSRKPAHLELAGGVGLRQRLWARIRACAKKDRDFSLAELVVGSENTATARDYLIGLEKGGWITLTAGPARQGDKTAKRWRLEQDNGVEAPRVRRDGRPVTQGQAQEQMWRALRMLATDINARELAAHATTPDVAVKVVAAHDYLGNLAAAGYLETIAPGHGTGRGGVQARYRLRAERNSGPRPPMVCRTQAVYDPNEGRVVWSRAPEHEEDIIYGR